LQPSFLQQVASFAALAMAAALIVVVLGGGFSQRMAGVTYPPPAISAATK
jgi:hypothetical protein